jgi:hypothetical protein
MAVEGGGREFVFLVGDGGRGFAGLEGGPEGVGAGDGGRNDGGVGYEPGWGLVWEREWAGRKREGRTSSR